MSETPIPLADVLLPLAVSGAYSYRVPEGMTLAPGDYVQVPLGPRHYIGVVWERRDSFGTNLKLRDVSEKYDMTPMTATHRKFIEWLSAYYLEPMGAVLRMVLRVPSAFEPERQRMAYVIGDIPPKKLTPQRTRVLETAREGFAMSAAELSQATGVGQSVIKALAEQGAL